MRRRNALGAALAGALLAGLLVAPQAPAAPPKTYEQSDPTAYIVETRHAKIYLEVIHPVDAGEIVEAPVILTLSPYSVLGRNGDAAHWVPKGYARAYADVIGTGNSGGCYDYGGKREKETGFDLVEWIAKQDWSTGKLAMIGGSYDGTTATATAVMNPPHLTTIVPEAAISRWYEYAYSGGIRYSWTNKFIRDDSRGQAADEGLDTPLLFDFGLALPPPVDVQDPSWAERVQSTITPCDELEHMMAGYNFDLPNYDDFWLERDYIKDAHKIDIPVLIAHNWGDWNVKQEGAVNLFKALKNSPSKHLYMGDSWSGHGTPGGEYAATVDAWMDHYLKGVNNGVQNLAPVTSQTANYDGAMDKWYSGAWPKTKKVSLIAQNEPSFGANKHPWMLKPRFEYYANPLFKPTPSRFPSTNVNTESHAAHHCRSNHDWFCFETLMFKKDTRLFGSITVDVWSHADRKWLTMIPSIVDVDMGYHESYAGQHVGYDPNGVVAFTRGFLDSRYRNGLDKPTLVKPNKSFGMTVVTKPQDYTIKAGHVLWVNLQTEALEWAVAKPYPGCETPDNIDTSNVPPTTPCVDVYMDWEDAKFRVNLPVMNAPKNNDDLFDRGDHDHEAKSPLCAVQCPEAI